MSPPSMGDRPQNPLPATPLSPGYRPSSRVLVALGSLLGLGLAFTYDYVIVANEHALVPGWDLTRLDWILCFGLLVVFWLGVVPLLCNPTRTRWYWRRLRRNRMALLAIAYVLLFSVTALVGPLLVGRQISNLYLQYQPPVFTSVYESVVGRCVGPVIDQMCHGTLRYPLGTNIMGLGVVYLIVKGARISFLVVLVAATMVAPIATIVGVVAGYARGPLDGVLMRYVDVQESVPAFLIYIIAVFFQGKSLPLLLGVFGLFSWGGVARMVRGETLQRRSAGYVRAARAAGAGRVFIIRRHILPNIRGTVVTATTQVIPGLLLAEIGIGYLRLTDEVLRSWGWTLGFAISGKHGTFPSVLNILPPYMLYPSLTQKWAPLVFTVLAAMLTVAAFAVLGDALRDIFDPRMNP